jgi:hypothetical protein
LDGLHNAHLEYQPYYYWRTGEWSIPINLFVSHIYDFGKQPVSLAVGGRWYADTVEDGPDWGLRAVATFLFPTGG